MLRLLMPVLALGLCTSFAEAQQAPVPPAQTSAQAYKVAFWYLADDSINSLKYHVYDLAKGEYDEKAVDRWFQEILDHHPDYGAYIRDISTEGRPGATEAERLEAAIATEKGRWSRLQRQVSKPIPKIVNLSPGRYSIPGSRLIQESRTSFARPSPGAPGGLSNPSTSPFPYPYRSGPR